MSEVRESLDYLRGAPALLAIVRAARAIGDRDLERAAKAQLLDEYGITIKIRRNPGGPPRAA
jgi:hypothetical protein